MSQHRRKVLLGSASNVARALVSLPISLILPPLFVRRMVPAEYGAWILIMQGSAYIALLDFGLQTAIAKFVAEYSAAGDRLASSRILSSAFALLCVGASIGALIISGISWRVPHLFRQMPLFLIGSIREGILLVGLSAALALPFNAFLATFIGLQEYAVPTLLTIAMKVLSSAALIGLLLTGGGLVQLAAAIAIFNAATAVCQFLSWEKYARTRVNFSILLIHRESILKLAKFGGALAIWTIAMLFVSGMDLLIVGHYDFANTGYYGVATTVTNFMLLLVASLFGPLGPAVSSLQSARTPAQIGDIVVTTTRLSTLLLCLIGLPIFIGTHPLLTVWVGHEYAMRSAEILQVLILGNAIRQLGYPYALVVIATGKQYQATFAAVAEASANLAASIYLVQRIGAIGVAIGTLIGAFVSVCFHIAISMRLTHSTVSLSRRKFVFAGILRPLVCVAPSTLIFPFWSDANEIPFDICLIAVCAAATLAIAWFVGLDPTERQGLRRWLSHMLPD